MLGHIGINVPDLGAARAYYGALLPALGFEPFLDAPDQFAFMPAAGYTKTYVPRRPPAGMNANWSGASRNGSNPSAGSSAP